MENYNIFVSNYVWFWSFSFEDWNNNIKEELLLRRHLLELPLSNNSKVWDDGELYIYSSVKCSCHAMPDASSVKLVTWEREQAGRAGGSPSVSREASPLLPEVSSRCGKGEGLGSVTAALQGKRAEPISSSSQPCPSQPRAPPGCAYSSPCPSLSLPPGWCLIPGLGLLLVLPVLCSWLESSWALTGPPGAASPHSIMTTE